MQRIPLIAGNWKMHMTVRNALGLVDGLLNRTPDPSGVELAVCPPFVCLHAVCERLRGSSIRVGAQTMHWAESGAHTGEISPGMLTEVGCQMVILGHSERRQHNGETDQQINQKVRSALAGGLDPILCVGESLAEREAGQAQHVVSTQVNAGLKVVSADDMARVTLAYEPVWAIGTGVVATPEMAQEIHQQIRMLLADRYGDGIAGRSRILYGGSMKPDNAAGLLKQQDIDGGLIGGASLEAESFLGIAQAVR